MKQFKVSIPKPCHEDWGKMTPKEKGRFCASCAKTVVDFTKKSTEEIQEYLIENRNKRVCGHFYRKQLDSIVLQIPEVTFQQQLSFQKLFILTLLLVMGTTLFSCKTDAGKVQKIDKVELIDTIVKTEKVIDTISVNKKKCETIKPQKIEKQEPTVTTGLPIIEQPLDTIIEVTGDIAVPDERTTGVVIEETLGELVATEINNKPEDTFCPLVILDSYPKFEKHKEVSNKDSKKLFKEEISMFIRENFKIESTKNLGLQSKKHRILSKIKIDNQGNIFDIQVRAPHPELKKDVEMILKKLPKFIPATKDGDNVATSYIVPITFVVE